MIGAGPARSRHVARACAARHSRTVVLERGDAVGHTWAHLYDSLVLHTGKHLSSLPGLPFPRVHAAASRRARDFLDYLHRYADTFRLPIETRE